MIVNIQGCKKTKEGYPIMYIAPEAEIVILTGESRRII